MREDLVRQVAERVSETPESVRKSINKNNVKRRDLFEIWLISTVLRMPNNWNSFYFKWHLKWHLIHFEPNLKHFCCKIMFTDLIAVVWIIKYDVGGAKWPITTFFELN